MIHSLSISLDEDDDDDDDVWGDNNDDHDWYPHGTMPCGGFGVRLPDMFLCSYDDDDKNND